MRSKTGMLASGRDYCHELYQAWNAFWFTPTDPATFSLVRVLAGAMLFYTHLIWSLDLSAFLGQEGWLPVDYLRSEVQVEGVQGMRVPIWSVWSIFFWIKTTWLLWCVHLVALVIFFCLMIGLFSRTTAVLGYLLAVSYVQRVSPGAFFGLDKVNVMMAMYLMLGPCGARYSLDRLLRLRREQQGHKEQKGHKKEPTKEVASTSANVAIRLIQIHMCIIYLFAGIAKLEGANWQAGTGVWWAVANLEYQSLNMTWLARWPMLVAIATHLTVFWEISYCFLVWNRYTRPLVLWTAMGVHAGIALAMGLMTFGLAMIIANLSFLSPATVRRWVDPLAARISLMLVGKQVG
ncbi:MAG: HTTM domain-containing protein [Pirellulales bacterium]